MAKASKTSPVKDILKLVEASLDDDKAENVVVIDLAGKTEIADFMIVANGRSQRQVGAMASNVQQKMKASGVTGIAIEGMPQCDWVLVDAGDIIIHIFKPEVRDFYNLEKIWTNPAGDTGADGANAELTA